VYRKHAGRNLFRRYENYEMCFECHTMIRILVHNSEHEKESLGKTVNRFEDLLLYDTNDCNTVTV